MLLGGGRLKTQHLKGHSGHPWNEYANSIATAITKHQYEAKPSLWPEDPLGGLAGNRDKLQWAWLYNESPLQAALPRVQDNGSWPFPIWQAKEETKEETKRAEYKEGEEPAEVLAQLDLGFSFCNVMTMKQARKNSCCFTHTCY